MYLEERRMKSKTIWTYNYKKGLKVPMVSNDYFMEGDNIYFALSLGLNAFDSVLLALNVKTQETRVVFEENHVVRTAGILENGKIYLTTFKGEAVCVSLDGSVCWATELCPKNASFKMALDGDRFYVSDYAVFCLDTNTGEILWKNQTYQAKNNCNIVYDDKYIYGGELGGSVFCLDKFSGEVRWAFGKDEWISSVALLDRNRMLVGHIHGKFYILDSQKGELICTREAKGKLYSEMVFENNRMYIGSADAVIDSKAGNMTCYEMSSDNDLTEIFSVNVGGGVSTKAVIDGDRLFFAAEDNYLYCVDKNTGEELMPRKKTKGICRNIVVQGKELFLLSDKGQVECLEIL